MRIRAQDKKPQGEGPEGRAPLPAVATVLPVLAGLLWLPQAALLALAVARLAAVASNGGAPEAVPAAAGLPWQDILLPALAAAVIGLLRLVLGAAGERAGYRSARATLTALRQSALLALGARSPLDTSRAPSGEAASMIAEQAESIVPWLARFGPARVKATVLPVAIFLAILPLSWAAALVLLLALPVIPLFMALIGWRAQAASRAQLVEVGAMNAFLLDHLRGLATIRGLGAVEAVAMRVRQEAQSLHGRTMAVLRIAFLTSAVLELFAALGVAMVAVYVGFHLLGDLGFGAWGGKLSLAQGFFILLLAPAFFEPMRELSAIWHDRAAGQAAFDNLSRLAKGAETAPPGPASAAVQPAPPAPYAAPATPAGAVPVVAIRASHPQTGKAFGFSVAQGEHVALVGPSGVGKTTLLSLIAGLAGPQAGEVEVFGQAMRAQTAPALRARMAWIGQTPHIFAGSLAQNVTLGRRGFDAEEVMQALVQMRLGDLARARGAMPIGENGTGLSGGEALRLALARAALDPRAELILADEPTAHLDPLTAEGITESLLRLARGRTLIVATHDPRLVQRMGRAIRLDPDLWQERAA